MIVNIAIDGPAGAGKSTIAKRVAKELSFIYVDTGAMYRAMAFDFIQKGIKPDESERIAEACRGADITIVYRDSEQQVLLNGANVTPYLRTEDVGNMASAGAANPEVRKKLVALQQKMGAEKSVVMDGRDIGTKVLPNASVKIYLTASTKTRAMRRFRELEEKGMPCDLNQIEQDIIQRDQRDMTRAISPLVQAEDAVLVDSSDMTVEEVVNRIISIYKEKVCGS